MSRSFPIFLGIWHSASFGNGTNTEDTSSEMPYDTQHEHKSDGNVYGINMAVMLLPLLTIIVLVTLYTRYRLNLQADRSCLLPCYYTGQSAKDHEGNGNSASLENKESQKTVKTRKPMGSDRQHGKVRYHQQSRKSQSNLASKRSCNEEGEYEDIYDGFGHDFESDFEDDEEIDLQKSTMLHSPPHFYPTSLLTASIASLQSLGSQATTSTTSSIASDSTSSKATIDDNSVQHRVMHSLGAALSFRAGKVASVQTSKQAAIVSEKDNTQCSKNEKATMNSHSFSRLIFSIGNFAKSKSAIPETEISVDSESNTTKRPVTLVLDTSQSKATLHPCNVYMCDPDTAVFRRHIGAPSVGVSTWRSASVQKSTNGSDNDKYLASDSEDDNSVHGMRLPSVFDRAVPIAGTDGLVTVFDDSPAVHHMNSLHPHQQKMQKQFAYSLQL